MSWRFEQSRSVTRQNLEGEGTTTYAWYAPDERTFPDRLSALRWFISEMEAEPSMASWDLKNLQRVWTPMARMCGARLVRVP